METLPRNQVTTVELHFHSSPKMSDFEAKANEASESELETELPQSP
jgi:hypothetical protein